MSFGVTTTPTILIDYMNIIFWPWLNKFIVVFIIYSKNPEERVDYLRVVLDVLREHQLYGKLSKCEF